ncbi:MarR family winged helix-turn-helix transcriptional regulator [Pedobacter sp. AW1-32]|uniref:MarR family winged helix-turn-helix transcriptional regulator n=1 Tax=Pedobacter sp. AW1-32 TaxID=3383026 RepID=UPI003FF0E651
MRLEQLSLKLRVVVFALQKITRKKITESTAYSNTELETISLIARNANISPTDLATQTDITTPSMSQILNKIESQGIIVRERAVGDKRKTFISLTAVGQEMVKRTRFERDEYLAQLLVSRLTQAELQTIEDALPALEKLIHPES